MKYLTAVAFLFFMTTSFCQSDEIYRLTFSDSSNFRITTYLDNKQPKKILIIDTTDQWYTARFWLDELNSPTEETLRKMKRNEHHPYNNAYLFTDTTLDNLISDGEKKSLAKTVATLKSKKIALKAKNYTTIHTASNIKGFYFVTSEPVFTSDMKYAFIDMTVFYKDKRKQDLNDTYFGHVCVVYEKQNENQWKKIRVKNRLIL